MSAGGTRRRCGSVTLIFALGGLALGCQSMAEPTLRVVVEVPTVGAESGASFARAGTIAVVAGVGSAEPRTVVAVAAREALEALRAALARNPDADARTEVKIVLPAATADLLDIECDIVLFEDRDGDAAWDTGEPFVTAWTGGRGSYRLVGLDVPGPEAPGAAPGWNLIEGGLPRTYHADLNGTPVSLQALRISVPGR